MEQYQRNWKNYYEILQVGPTARSSSIVASYRRLAREYHPDTAKNTNASVAKMIELNEAYEVLSNPIRKADYDREFKMIYAPQQDVAYRHASSAESHAARRATYSPVSRSRYSINKVLKLAVNCVFTVIGGGLIIAAILGFLDLGLNQLSFLCLFFAWLLLGKSLGVTVDGLRRLFKG